MKKFTSLLALACMILLTTSCSKEKKLEKRLRSNAWNIDQVDWVKTYTGMGGINVEVGSETNAGTYTFNKGSGNATMSIDNETENFNFDWSNTETNITLDMDVVVTGTTTYTRVLAVDEFDKNSMVWVLVEVKQDTQGQYTLQAEMQLSN